MGNIQSFNNFASTITNTFSLPFINRMLKKNNLQSITPEQYSLFKTEGFKKKDILQFKSFKKVYSQITKEEYKKLKENNFGFEEILEFIGIKEKYRDIKVDHYINYKIFFETSEEILDYYRLKDIDRDLTPGNYKYYINYFKTFDKAKQYLEGKKLDRDLTISKYNDYLEAKKLDRDLTVDKYIDYLKHFKTFYKAKQYLEVKKLDRDLTVDKYQDYLKQLKTSKDVIKYLTFNTKYPQNNLTFKEYKDISYHNLKQLTQKQMNDFFLLKKRDQKNVLTVDDMKQLAKKIPDLNAKLSFIALKENFPLLTVDEYKKLLNKNYTAEEIGRFLVLKTTLKSNFKSVTDDDIESLMKAFKTDVSKMVDFGKLKSEFRLLTVDEYKKLLKENYTLLEMKIILVLKPYNVLTDDEIKRLIKEFGITKLQEMVDFVLLKKDFRLFTLDEYKKMLKLEYQPSEIRKLLEEKQKQGQTKQIYNLILQENQAMIRKLQTKTVQERNEMNRIVTNELLKLNKQKPFGYKDRRYKLGTLKKNIQSLAQSQERRKTSRSSKTSQSQQDIDQID